MVQHPELESYAGLIKWQRLAQKSTQASPNRPLRWSVLLSSWWRISSGTESGVGRKGIGRKQGSHTQSAMSCLSFVHLRKTAPPTYTRHPVGHFGATSQPTPSITVPSTSAIMGGGGEWGIVCWCSPLATTWSLPATSLPARAHCVTSSSSFF